MQLQHIELGEHNWLVVSTPLKNISQLGSLFPISGKNRSHVPNHQPEKQYNAAIRIQNLGLLAVEMTEMFIAFSSKTATCSKKNTGERTNYPVKLSNSLQKQCNTLW
jgi:hypothetical protein